MGRKKIIRQYIDICSSCSKEVGPYVNILLDRVTICPDCGKWMIHTDDKCYEVVKLLQEINLKPTRAVSSWKLRKGSVGEINIRVHLDMPYDEAMFSDLPNFEFFTRGNILTEKGMILSFGDNSALRCKIDNITNNFVGVKYLGGSDVQQVLDSHIEELKNWCKDYQENYEGRWAVGKLAGWLD